MQQLEKKIEASDCNISQVLTEKKYSVDYFQREYQWTEKHMEELITDLTGAFLNEYTPGDSREEGLNYNNYYLGPFVVCNKGGQLSIIDGQQRLTSLTLFLIFLNNLQKDFEHQENITPMIFSELRGVKSFNITVDERIPCLKSLFETGDYQIKENDDESTINMLERYQDIEQFFPEELKKEAFPHFVDWLKYNVILVKITANSDENAYTIFETMNDRGLSLTSAEMLKGFILSKFKNAEARKRANETWKKKILDLKSIDQNDDSKFFQAWLRGQYADTIRPGKAGSKNEDFEKIGTRFHSWFRDNLDKMELDSDKKSFETFFDIDFHYFFESYLKILKAEQQLTTDMEYVYYINHWGIAPTLSYPLMLAPLVIGDSEAITKAKINLVARYIETFVVRRSVNFKNFSANSIRYTMYSLVKEIRHKSLDDLRDILSQKLNSMGEKFNAMANFRLHGQNRRFVKYLLSRITAWVEKEAGMGSNFLTYYNPEHGKPFEVEHIWADKFSRHTDEFSQESEFEVYRNHIGDLLLLPRGSNQSYGDKPYEQKQAHYIKENLLAKSLCELTYKNNPNFTNFIHHSKLPFKPHNTFKKMDIDQRQQLYQEICERMWNESLE